MSAHLGGPTSKDCIADRGAPLGAPLRHGWVSVYCLGTRSDVPLSPTVAYGDGFKANTVLTPPRVHSNWYTSLFFFSEKGK